MILPTFLNLLFVLWFLNCFLSKKNRKRIYVFLWMFIISLLLSYVNQSGITMLGKVLTFSLFYLCSFFCFQGTKMRITYIFMIGYFILILSEFITLAIINLLPDFHSLDKVISFLFMTACTQFFNYVTGYILKWFFYLNASKKGVVIHIIPLILTAFFIMNVTDYRILFDKNAFYLIIFLFMMIIDLFSIIMMKYTLDNLKAKKELELSQTKKSILKSQYELIYNNYNINFSFLHHSLHTLSELKRLIEQNRIEDFYTQINEFADKTQKNLYAIYSNSPAISTFLLKNKEILLYYHISIHSTLKSRNLEMILSHKFAKFINIVLDYAVHVCINTNAVEKVIIVKSDDIGTDNSIFKVMFTSAHDVITATSTNIMIDSIKKDYSESIDMIYKKSCGMIEMVIHFKANKK